MIDETFQMDGKLNRNCIRHDASKFRDPEMKPYIDITWYYKTGENKKEPNERSKQLSEAAHKATWHHISTNPHHPEYWDSKATIACLNASDRDKPSGDLIDATRMDDISIMEMCADWISVGKERGNNPLDWADMNINKRWKFSDDQIGLIHMILDKIK